MALGDRIRQLGEEAGWSQAELGDKIGADSQRVSRYETGKITPSLDAIVRIAEALNISIDHLPIDGIPRRPLHAAEHNLGDRLTALSERDRRARWTFPAGGHARRSGAGLRATSRH
jgi:transcriptional regulator with XRE-family HTH domain